MAELNSYEVFHNQLKIDQLKESILKEKAAIESLKKLSTETALVVKRLESPAKKEASSPKCGRENKKRSKDSTTNVKAAKSLTEPKSASSNGPSTCKTIVEKESVQAAQTLASLQ
mmetsp:Transcript_18695/g.28631  ORF Transcript_18695/g.28631 Transcript_18695/m.28631 type:complete len:115 (+) Transcript_18695:580-924(+)|eukprot:CAMPEP_0170495978 /NCGR_PEP_ID=MMETSP0208-20121228/19502_1 /TAXON_ID=197538 /ORGANISM="Strombidium inclinatum, Strain S3" /LENGTH=114 /DNA_ID=CAMNT_0010772395 /DNA_START=508 /DNA_END=852 /DNA_ORIENTATION=+